MRFYANLLNMMGFSFPNFAGYVLHDGLFQFLNTRLEGGDLLNFLRSQEIEYQHLRDEMVTLLSILLCTSGGTVFSVVVCESINFLETVGVSIVLDILNKN